jgi:hypothetical protein
MASSDKWRINCSATLNPGSWLSTSEVEMRATVGGADQCTGGTASASAQNATNVASRAFDNSTSTIYQSGTGTMPVWLQYQFAAAVTVGEVMIRSTNTAGDAPSSFTIEYWDGSAWQVAKTVAGVLWKASQQKTFPIGSVKASSDASEWRVFITDNQGSGTFSSIAEVELRATIGGADQCTGGTPWASSVNFTQGSVAGGFDNSNSTKWQAVDATLPQWLAYAFTTAPNVTELALTAPATNVGDTPTVFRLQYHDSEQWQDKYSIVTPATWTAGEQRVFSSSSAIAARRRQFINC